MTSRRFNSPLRPAAPFRRTAATGRHSARATRSIPTGFWAAFNRFAGGPVPRDRYVLETPERTWRTNNGEFEFRMTTAVTTGGQILDKNQGFNSGGTRPARRRGVPRRSTSTLRKIVRREGRAPVVGTELVESLIKRNLAERTRLRDKVAATFKKRRKAAAKVEDAG